MEIEARPDTLGLSASRLARVTDWSRRWVDSGRLPCALVAVMRRGRLGYVDWYGHRDVESETPVEADTLFRIYSMTKPIATVAALMLYEEGHYQLDQPVSDFIPAFGATRVLAGGDENDYDTEALERPMSVRDLMTHTSGLTYAFQNESPVDALYRSHGIDFQTNELSLGDMVERAAEMPLLFQPGQRWNYGISTDVLGRLVEIWSGQPLDRFLAERVFGPLGMTDTGFHVPPDDVARFASNYVPDENGGLALYDAGAGSRFTEPAVTFSGGGGLVSSAADYLRFASMLLDGGAHAGERLLGRKTVELMTANHLPGDLASMGQARFSEMPYYGIGFGLGVSVMLDPAAAHIVGSPGEFAWGGMASTAFWVDPAEEMVVLLLTQLTPSSTYPIRRELRVLTYQAVVD